MSIILNNKEILKKESYIDMDKKIYDWKYILAVVKKHKKPDSNNPQGGIVEKEAPLDISNVSLVTSEGKPTRVGFRIEDGIKVRYSKKTDELI